MLDRRIFLFAILAIQAVLMGLPIWAEPGTCTATNQFYYGNGFDNCTGALGPTQPLTFNNVPDNTSCQSYCGSNTCHATQGPSGTNEQEFTGCSWSPR